MFVFIQHGLTQQETVYIEHLISLAQLDTFTAA